VGQPYWNGIGTRSADPVFQSFLGAGASASTVSRVTCAFDDRIERFAQRPVEERRRCPVLDAAYLLAVRGQGATR
jgi:transposase-like protein